MPCFRGPVSYLSLLLHLLLQAFQVGGVAPVVLLIKQLPQLALLLQTLLLLRLLLLLAGLHACFSFVTFTTLTNTQHVRINSTSSLGRQLATRSASNMLGVPVHKCVLLHLTGILITNTET